MQETVSGQSIYGKGEAEGVTGNGAPTLPSKFVRKDAKHQQSRTKPHTAQIVAGGILANYSYNKILQTYPVQCM